jgi:hypothetical protein
MFRKNSQNLFRKKILNFFGIRILEDWIFVTLGVNLKTNCKPIIKNGNGLQLIFLYWIDVVFHKMDWILKLDLIWLVVWLRLTRFFTHS